jgi:ectoine/hydroxyectoine ABC transporter permease protein EhuD
MLTRWSDLFDLHGVGDYLPTLLKGAATSIELTVCILAISLPLGLAIALAKMSPRRAPRALASAYIEVIRGTPALLQLFYIYFVLPAFGIRFSPFLSGVIGLSINYAAYLAEVYRAGVEAVPRGQVEAAKALGMSRGQAMRLVVLPQAIRVVIPPLGNHAIALFKDTSLVSIVTVKELIFSGQIIAATNFQYLTVFTIIGVIYLAFSYPSALLVRWLERRMSVERRGAVLAAARPGAAAP